MRKAKTCPICGRQTFDLKAALWEHLKPYQRGDWRNP